jgi:putative SOS response-associated peptidase YedK
VRPLRLLEAPADVAARFGLAECAEDRPRFNIPPGADIPVIRLPPEGKRMPHLPRRGLTPRWAEDPAIGARLITPAPRG